ncbi:MAG: RNA recognition motif domain-containing protein [Bacteroidota bacterium]
MNIYVGNLHYDVQDEDLKEVFTEYGEVESVKIVTDRNTGRSKGFGFVVMDNDSGARALEELNGVELMGREMKVSEARERTNNQNRGGGRGGYNSNRRQSRF